MESTTQSVCSAVRVVRRKRRDSLLVQWLGRLAFTALAKIPQAVWHGQNKNYVWSGAGEWGVESGHKQRRYRGTQPDQGGLTWWRLRAEGELSHN